MTAETMLAALVRLNLVASVAILVVLLLRSWVLRWLGASIAYWLWLVVPITAAASLLPARERIVVGPEVVTLTREAPGQVAAGVEAPAGASARVAAPPRVFLPALDDSLVAVWLLGAVVLFVRSIVRTRRLAAEPTIGPALVGVLRPRLVLPVDFETRFDAEERALVLAHEEVHRVSGHTIVNALVEVARCASWFNPLAHLAAGCVRADQELACDAAVIAARPSSRRAYAHALLKTQIAPAFLPLGCVWTSRSARHLRTRIGMLGRPSLGRRGAVAGAAAVAIVGVATGYAAWAQQPERLVTQTGTPPKAVWTPTSAAPVGLLTTLEGQRHDRFIDRARAGDIDIVFFGTTSAEMWFWPDRGLRVWDRTFGSLKAASFGSQGTRFESLLWRMQNGELGGYQAKLVVLQIGSTTGDQVIPARGRAEFVTGYSAVIAEVRARQPQARILLFAAFPRGQLRRDPWREVAGTNAAVYRELADDKTVFYVDIGERFFGPDGSYNGEMWNASGPPNAGIQEAAFEVWAKELQPWLDRFVR
jgi:beta-lactamase regulating signal transducer with metallopeptidase domain